VPYLHKEVHGKKHSHSTGKDVIPMLSGKSNAVGKGSTFGVAKRLTNEKGRKNQKIKDMAAATAIQ
jgi:hypothetical protein